MHFIPYFANFWNFYISKNFWFGLIFGSLLFEKVLSSLGFVLSVSLPQVRWTAVYTPAPPDQCPLPPPTSHHRTPPTQPHPTTSQPHHTTFHSGPHTQTSGAHVWRATHTDLKDVEVRCVDIYNRCEAASTLVDFVLTAIFCMHHRDPPPTTSPTQNPYMQPPATHSHTPHGMSENLIKLFRNIPLRVGPAPV